MIEFDQILKEATIQTEALLNLEDQGWINLSAGSEVIPAESRKLTVHDARLYGLKDPLAKRAVALMTDYAFGSGISWNAEDEKANSILTDFWVSPGNKPLFSAKGQRKSSDKLLIDGEIFFAVFLGSQTTIRRIDPLEITEFVSDPDDYENVRYYKRDWVDTQGKSHVDYYRSFANLDDVSCQDSTGKPVQSSQEALIYHLAINDLGQRGNSYLLASLEWIKLYRKFLASRVAVMLALARFAWKVKVSGSVAGVRATYHEEEIKAGSTSIENSGADLQPIRTDSGASNAYQDGRTLKLQVSAATGFPEQYFGDISIGNLATAKTVELPVQKMIESYQAIWKCCLEDIFELVLTQNGVSGDALYIDLDFPAVTEESSAVMSQTITQLVSTFPQLANSNDVLQQALLTLGIKNTNEVIDALDKISKESKSDPNIALSKALKEFRGVVGAYRST